MVKIKVSWREGGTWQVEATKYVPPYKTDFWCIYYTQDDGTEKCAFIPTNAMRYMLVEEVKEVEEPEEKEPFDEQDEELKSHKEEQEAKLFEFPWREELGGVS